MVSSKPKLLPRAMSGSMAVQQLGAESPPVTPVATKSYVVPLGLIGHLGLTILVPMGHAASRAIQWHVLLSSVMVSCGTRLMLRSLSGSVSL